MQILSHFLNKEVVHGQGCSIHLAALEDRTIVTLPFTWHSCEVTQYILQILTTLLFHTAGFVQSTMKHAMLVMPWESYKTMVVALRAKHTMVS